MKTYIIKETFNGLLSAIFYYYANKDNNVLVFSNYNKTSFIDEIIEIETEIIASANRLFQENEEN